MFEVFKKFSRDHFASIEWLKVKALKLFQKYSLPRWLVFVVDLLSVFAIFFLAYLLRFNFRIPDFRVEFALIQSIIILAVYAFYELLFKPYSGLIRHTTIIDIFHVLLSTSAAVISLIIITLISRNLDFTKILNIPISIILIHYVTVTLFLFLTRIIVKILFQLISANGDKKNVLIYGAGDSGVVVKRVIDSDIHGLFRIFGFLDSSKKLFGKKVNGIPVFHPNVLCSDFVIKAKIKTIIIAVRELSAGKKSDIIRLAMANGLEVLESPPIDKWLNGQLNVRQLKKVNLIDLLGRDPIMLDLDMIAGGLKGKTILVTGAAGSIGSELVRQVARFKSKQIILADQAETPVFHLINELKKQFVDLNYTAVLADVTNLEKMELIFKNFHPDIVFHAAAYKHVPLLEDNPHEAYRVNVGGTSIITDLSIKYGVSKFVMISTDKSVNPTNVMGASKRICELVVQAKAAPPGVKTQFVITRFGNVLGSNGSVVPEFSKQITEGGPITITHPDITRYFMTIAEACQLVLEAGFMGKGGEIFIFDMGAPVKIADLANNMIRLSGLEPGKDIRIVFTGLRPGEKLYEELLSEKEIKLPTHHPKIMIAQVDLNGSKTTLRGIESLLHKLYSYSSNELVEEMEKIVPMNSLLSGKNSAVY